MKIGQIRWPCLFACIVAATLASTRAAAQPQPRPRPQEVQQQQQQQQQKKPNIVMLMTDDTGWGDFGYMPGGGKSLSPLEGETPHSA